MVAVGEPMYTLIKSERIVSSVPNTNNIQVEKFGSIRIPFGVPLLSEQEYQYFDYANNTEDKCK